MAPYTLAPYAFALSWKNADGPTRKRWVSTFARVVALTTVIVVFVAWAWARSPAVSSADPFDVPTEITSPLYEIAKANRVGMRYVSHFIVYCLYVIMTCFVFHYITGDFWALIQLGSAFLLSLVTSTLVGIPESPDVIEYWDQGFFPLEHLIRDNIVCHHLVICWVCSHSLIQSTGSKFVSLVLWTYGVCLVIFLLATRNTNSSALGFAVACAMAAEKFRVKFEYWWSLLLAGLVYAFTALWRWICCHPKAEDTERQRLAGDQSDDKGTYSVNVSDEEEEEEPVKSTLFATANGSGPAATGVADL